MPIIFISLNEQFIDKIKYHGYQAFLMNIEDYASNPMKKTYYVSPANSLGFMDGGIDYPLSRIIFPNIETEVQQIINNFGFKNLINQPYLPIGSSIILDKENNKSLIVAPTMLSPQNVSKTKNAYYSTMAILYNILINNSQNLDDVDIIFTSLCCGYGHMDINDSIKQILDGINDYKKYNPQIVNKNIIINEPNINEQPKYYENKEFFPIEEKEIIYCNQS